MEYDVSNAYEIKTNPDLLKQFLKYLIDIETSVYTSRMRLLDLYRYKVQIAEDLDIQKNTAGIAEKQLVAEAENNLRNRPRESAYSSSCPKEPIPPRKPILQQAGLFNKKKVQEANEIALAEYEKKKEQYEIEYDDYKTALTCFEAEVAKKVASEKAKAEQALEEAKIALDRAISSPKSLHRYELETVIKTEIDNTIELVKSQIKCKNELYTSGIVYGKYRDLVALSSFYEYLLAGRCTSLEGSDGAYNIYEGEIRSDLIISKLSDVVESLEEIKKNQYMVYTQLHSAALDLEKLNSKMDSALAVLDYVPAIAKSAEMIAYNTEQTAYYAKKNKELTDALGFMVALK